jgi:hypothetical protein
MVDENREEMLNYTLPDGYDSAEQQFVTVFDRFELTTINEETELDDYKFFVKDT